MMTQANEPEEESETAIAAISRTVRSSDTSNNNNIHVLNTSNTSVKKKFTLTPTKKMILREVQEQLHSHSYINNFTLTPTVIVSRTTSRSLQQLHAQTQSYLCLIFFFISFSMLFKRFRLTINV
jgi:hypothetical protein